MNFKKLHQKPFFFILASILVATFAIIFTFVHYQYSIFSDYKRSQINSQIMEMDKAINFKIDLAIRESVFIGNMIYGFQYSKMGDHRYDFLYQVIKDRFKTYANANENTISITYFLNKEDEITYYKPGSYSSSDRKISSVNRKINGRSVAFSIYRNEALGDFYLGVQTEVNTLGDEDTTYRESIELKIKIINETEAKILEDNNSMTLIIGTPFTDTNKIYGHQSSSISYFYQYLNNLSMTNEVRDLSFAWKNSHIDTTNDYAGSGINLLNNITIIGISKIDASSSLRNTMILTVLTVVFLMTMLLVSLWCVKLRYFDDFLNTISNQIDNISSTVVPSKYLDHHTQSQRNLITSVSSAIFKVKRMQSKIFELEHEDPETLMPNEKVLYKHLNRSYIDKPMRIALFNIQTRTLENFSKGSFSTPESLIINMASEHIKNLADEGAFQFYRTSRDEFVLIYSDTDEFCFDRVIDDLINFITNNQSNLVSGIDTTINTVCGKRTLNESPVQLMSNIRSVLGTLQGTGRKVYLTSEVRDEIRRQEIIERDIYNAFHSGEMEIYFQPSYDTKNGRMVALNIYPRWNHPALGRLTYADFIDYSNKLGLTNRFFSWVMSESLSQLSEWDKSKLRKITLIIRVNKSQITNKDNIKEVKKLVEQHGVLPKRIVFALQQECLMVESSELRQAMEDLREVGFNFAINNFGGEMFAGNNAITSYPYTHIILNKSLIDKLKESNSYDPFVEAIYRFSKENNKIFMANYVDDITTSRKLVALGVSHISGYIFDHPTNQRNILDSFYNNIKNMIG